MKSNDKAFPRAGLFRRLAAIIYDALVVTANGMCAALVVLMICYQNGLIEKNNTDHFMDFFRQSIVFTTLMQIWVGLWMASFFLWFWKNGGQTIGMRAWRLRLFSMDEKPMGYGRALIRLFGSLGGLGTLLVLIDFKNKLALQDRLSKTEILVLTKDANHHKAWKSI